MSPRLSLSLCLLCAAPALFPWPALPQVPAYEEAPHHYWTRPLKDTGSLLDQELRTGTFQLPPQGSDQDKFRAILRRLRIPESSQTLVFSKTSVQKDRISPWNPRAIFFNEENYAAWMPGGLVEITSLDPVLGPIFYTLDFDRPDRPAPRLDRPQSCLDCHGGNMTNRVPGLMLRSVFPDREGSVLFQAGTSLIDHTSPLETRWGGWYVTGRHGETVHRGNAFARDRQGTVTLQTGPATSNLDSLSQFFPAENYPHGASSDLIALMVLEHQVMITSRLVEAAYDVRSALIRQQALREELGEPPTDQLTGTARTITESHAGKILEVLLFRDEAELPPGGIRGQGTFEKDYQAAHPRSPDGTSLADFHLGNRLFRHRCSPMIYSRLWLSLPRPLLDLLYSRLHSILTAPSPPPGFGHLSAPERRTIFRILLATHPDLPPSWKN